MKMKFSSKLVTRESKSVLCTTKYHIEDRIRDYEMYRGYISNRKMRNTCKIWNRTGQNLWICYWDINESFYWILKAQTSKLLILKPVTCIFLLFCTISNKCTINWQIITLLLHVSTLLCNLRQWPTSYTFALFYNTFIIILYMFRALYTHHKAFKLY